MKYGRSHYDYQEESLIFIAPGQVFGFELSDKILVQPSGWALVFHPDFIRGTALGRHIKDYTFSLMMSTKPYISPIVKEK